MMTPDGDPWYPQVMLDCRSVHRRVVPRPDTSLRSDLGELTAWLGQRNQDNFLFKVKLFSFQSVEVTSKGEGVGGKIKLYEVISLFLLTITLSTFRAISRTPGWWLVIMATCSNVLTTAPRVPRVVSSVTSSRQ